jgi:hypothetical protein
MKIWYCVLLLAAAAGGWFAYPRVYPAMTGFLTDGRLPWDLEPDPLGEGDDSEGSQGIADDKPEPTNPTVTAAPQPVNPNRRPNTAHLARPRIAAPEFASLEELVGNWNTIPASAFPRSIKLKTSVTYKITGGTGTLTIGSTVVALSAKGDKLTISPNENSKLRMEVDIDQTDFKDVLSAVFEKFKRRKTKEFAAAQQEARDLEATPDSPVTASNDELAIIDVPFDPVPGQATRANTPRPPKPANLDANTKQIVGEAPLQYLDGTVPAMVRSMESGQVKEIRRDMIHYWGRMHFGKLDSQPYWVCSVDYTARTIFGIFPTQAKALMRKGKVIKWIYTGSEEPVP